MLYQPFTYPTPDPTAAAGASSYMSTPSFASSSAGLTAVVSPDELGAQDLKKPILAKRFRTEMCRSTLCGKRCPYETRCMFAHSVEEIRTAEQNLADGLTSEESIKEWKARQQQRARNRRRRGKNKEKSLASQAQQGGDGMVGDDDDNATTSHEGSQPPSNFSTPGALQSVGSTPNALLFSTGGGDGFGQTPSLPFARAPHQLLYLRTNDGQIVQAVAATPPTLMSQPTAVQPVMYPSWQSPMAMPAGTPTLIYTAQPTYMMQPQPMMVSADPSAFGTMFSQQAVVQPQPAAALPSAMMSPQQYLAQLRGSPSSQAPAS